MNSPDGQRPLDVMHTLHLTHSPQDYDRTRIFVDRSLRLSSRTPRIQESDEGYDDLDEDLDSEEAEPIIYQNNSSGWQILGMVETGSTLDGF